MGSQPDRLSRRQVLSRLGSVVLGSAAAAAGSALRAQSVRSGPPNIIFILADDLGYGDLGCYGQTQILTPNLDWLAARGVRFTDCYSGSPACAPSRCSLLTGLHTGHTRLRVNEDIPLSPQDVTVAEVLKQAGYATAAIGKWHLGDVDTTGIPNLQGFDHFFGILNGWLAINYYPTELWRNRQLVKVPGNENGQEAVYAPDLFTEEAISFIKSHASQPFFLYLPYTIPHVNRILANQTGNGYQVPTAVPYRNRSWPQVEKNYAAMVTRMDGYIGRVMETLRAQGIDRNTVVFFSSDNGPTGVGDHDVEFFNSNGPLRGEKPKVYEGGIRVPMICYWPDRIPARRVSDRVWAFWDFLPTAAAIAGAAAPAKLDGVSALPLLLGGSQPDHAPLYWEFRGAERFAQAVRTGVWKGVRYDGAGPVELYDLSKDIGERQNLATKHPSLVKQVRTLMHDSRVAPPPRISWVDQSGRLNTGVAPQVGHPVGSASPTLFQFRVRYWELSGLPPLRAECIIERLTCSGWEPFLTLPMRRGSGDFVDGVVYVCKRRLSLQVLRYRFRFDAKTGRATGEPTCFHYGPGLIGAGQLCRAGGTGFEANGVDPQSGPKGTRFTFAVRYMSSQGQAPTTRQVLIRRNNVLYRELSMTPDTAGSYQLGKVFRASLVLKETGNYSYRFRFAGASGVASGPPRTWQTGPTVGATRAGVVTSLAVAPTGAGAQVTLTLSASAEVWVMALNVSGRPIREIASGKRMESGTQTLLWDARAANGLRAPSGLYLIRVVARTADGLQSSAMAPLTLR